MSSLPLPSFGALLKRHRHAAGLTQEALAERALSAFYHYFFSLDETAADGGSAPLVPPRTRKHIASPEKNSSCKRINMFLRWMVRRDGQGVDFGLWRRIGAEKLVCPLDLHVARVAKKFRLLTRPSADLLAAMELTGRPRRMTEISQPPAPSGAAATSCSMRVRAVSR